MKKFRSKPVECEAEQWRGSYTMGLFPEGAIKFDSDEDVRNERFYVVTCQGQKAYLARGDWVIAEPDAPGCYYPCKPEVFEKRWELLLLPNYGSNDPKDLPARIGKLEEEVITLKTKAELFERFIEQITSQSKEKLGKPPGPPSPPRPPVPREIA